ncbi:hypothetical protein HQ524_02810 [Candidatus Uhrbacteria bacterium]|nr:hypothetical protein [Candidatus Uhrbacteria bacterium]
MRISLRIRPSIIAASLIISVIGITLLITQSRALSPCDWNCFPTVSKGAVATSTDRPAVYAIGSTGSMDRRAFPRKDIYDTWYEDFSIVTEASIEDLTQMSLSKPMLPKPGTALIKYQYDPSLYISTSHDQLRRVSGVLLEELYGDSWESCIIEMPEEFKFLYNHGQSADFARPVDVVVRREEGARANVEIKYAYEDIWNDINVENEFARFWIDYQDGTFPEVMSGTLLAPSGELQIYVYQKPTGQVITFSDAQTHSVDGDRTLLNTDVSPSQIEIRITADDKVEVITENPDMSTPVTDAIYQHQCRAQIFGDYLW